MIDVRVMGATGVGKSTFINSLLKQEVATVGHSLVSQTVQLTAYPLKDPNFPNNRIMIVDTPGFDDTAVSDKEILRRISVWLARSYKARMKLCGVIYIHNITHNRFVGASAKTFQAFEKLCGTEAAGKVVLATTMWDKIPPEEGEKRERELKDAYWKSMVELGSTIHRVDRYGRNSAQEIVNALLTKNDPHPLKIQKDLVDHNRCLKDTEVGRIFENS